MCHLMKHYTLVTIIRRDTGASGMYQIPASGRKHLRNMVLPPPASLSHLSSPPTQPLIFPPIFPYSRIPQGSCLIYTFLMPILHILTLPMHQSQQYRRVNGCVEFCDRFAAAFFPSTLPAEV